MRNMFVGASVAMAMMAGCTVGGGNSATVSPQEQAQSQSGAGQTGRNTGYVTPAVFAPVRTDEFGACALPDPQLRALKSGRLTAAMITKSGMSARTQDIWLAYLNGDVQSETAAIVNPCVQQGLGRKGAHH